MADGGELPAERANRIADAVEAIERDLTWLREQRELSHDEYRADDNQVIRDAVERKFEKLTEATLDVATQIALNEGRPVPDRRKGRIDAIENTGIIDANLAEQLRDTVAFRDVLAHTYGPIVNDDLVYDALQHGLGRYVRFVVAVDEYMAKYAP